jgi:hypothetical protein
MHYIRSPCPVVIVDFQAGIEVEIPRGAFGSWKATCYRSVQPGTSELLRQQKAPARTGLILVNERRTIECCVLGHAYDWTS